MPLCSKELFGSFWVDGRGLRSPFHPNPTHLAASFTACSLGNSSSPRQSPSELWQEGKVLLAGRSVASFLHLHPPSCLLGWWQRVEEVVLGHSYKTCTVGNYLRLSLSLHWACQCVTWSCHYLSASGLKQKRNGKWIITYQGPHQPIQTNLHNMIGLCHFRSHLIFFHGPCF